MDRLAGKESEIQLIRCQFALETCKLNDIIGKLKNEIHALWESKEKMELEWNNEKISRSKVIEKLNKNVEDLSESKMEMEVKFHEKIENEKTLATWIKNQIIEKLGKDLKSLRESKEKLELDFKKMKLELNNELQGKETEFRKYQHQAKKTLEMKNWASGVQNQTIEKLRKDLKNLRENQEKMELDLSK